MTMNSDFTTMPGYEMLQSDEGWRTLLLGTAKQLSANHDPSKMITQQIRNLKAVTQNHRTMVSFINEVENRVREISKWCRIADIDRIPKPAEWMDIIEQGADDDIREIALRDLTQIQKLSRSKFTYTTMRRALLDADRAKRDMRDDDSEYEASPERNSTHTTLAVPARAAQSHPDHDHHFDRAQSAVLSVCHVFFMKQ